MRGGPSECPFPEGTPAWRHWMEERGEQEMMDQQYYASVDEAGDAMGDFLAQPASQFLHYPWPDLDRIVGGMLPGELHYICAFSGNGKTLFMLSLVHEWLQQGKRIYFLGLETIPKYLLVNLCALREGIHAPDVLTGRAFHEPHWPELRDRLRRAREWYAARELYLSPVEHVGPREIDAAYRHAAELGADVLMIDHVDHIAGDSGQLYAESVLINAKIEQNTKAHNVLTVASSQLNLEAVRNDPLAQYRPPRPEHVKMGNKKRELGTSMVGLYRPIRTDVTKDELKAVRDGAKDAISVLTPWQMACSIMKNRKGGNDGAKCVLGTEGYRVQHLPERDRYSTTELRYA